MWANDFIGTPWKDHGRSMDGCDCWGLVRLVFARTFGIFIPSYCGEYISADESREIEAIISREKENQNWEKVETPKEGDVILLRIGRYERHVGVCVTNNLMLHMAVSDCAKIEDFTKGKWASRVIGFYRWKP